MIKCNLILITQCVLSPISDKNNDDIVSLSASQFSPQQGTDTTIIGRRRSGERGNLSIKLKLPTKLPKVSCAE